MAVPRRPRFYLSVLIALVVLPLHAQMAELVLHAFGSPPGGYYPYAPLVRDANGNLYGTTVNGGPANAGVVYKVSSTGQQTVLYGFTGGADGGYPYGGVALDSAGNIYGATSSGGAGNAGVVFKLNSSGVETVLYTFAGGTLQSPLGSVVLDASGNLYGTASGVEYKISSSGQFSILSFLPGQPQAGVVLDSAGNSYGTIAYGGAANAGAVYKVDPSGKLTVLYTFKGAADGGTPYGGVALDSSGNIYGAATKGGTSNDGVVFEISPSGQETVLYNFTGGADGNAPYGTPVLDASGNLYGTTLYGGTANLGVVFMVAPGGAESVLYTFEGRADGANPYAGVILDAQGNLYGTGVGGQGGLGVVYKVAGANNETVLYTFPGGPDGISPSSGVVADALGNHYGTTEYGGPGAGGILYKVDTSGNETVLHAFTNGADGGAPSGNLVFDASGNLYGTAVTGGAANVGLVFKASPAGVITPLYTFTGGSDGKNPFGGVIFDSSGNLYGTTFGGGANGVGAVFKLDTSGHESVLYSFTGSADGENPKAGLAFDLAGNLYGTTFNGGSSGLGTIFKVDTSGHETTLHSFDGLDGGQPAAALTLNPSGSLFYGTATTGGASFNGSLFQIGTTGTFADVYSFNYGGGAQPQSGVVYDSSGNLYGTAFNGGGDPGDGVVYSLNPNSPNRDTLLHTFIGRDDGGFPAAGVILDSSGNIYGTTTGGGHYQTGVVFKLTASTRTISGQVLASGKGIQGIVVTLSGSSAAVAYTDSNGNFSFTAATGGSYTITPSGAGYSFTPPNASYTNLNGNQTQNFTAANLTYTVSGQITGPGGAGVNGASVQASCNGSQLYTGNTNSSGNYSISAPAYSYCNVAASLGSYTFRPYGYFTIGNLFSNQIVNFEAIPPDDSDFNNSGYPDIVWQNPANGATQIWFLGGPQGVTVTGATNLVTSNPWRIVGMADFNQDGVPDVVWQDPVGGAVQVWLLEPISGTTGFKVMQAWSLAARNSWKVVSVADFNRDGHPDLLWQNPANGAVQIWYMNQAQVLSAANVTTSNPWRVAGTGDFNGDGFIDIVWQSPSGTVQVWYMGGTNTGAVGSQVISAANLTVTTWNVVAIADFNLDGHPDVVFQDPNSGTSQVNFYTGAQGTTFVSTAPLSGANTWVIAGPH